MGKEETSDAHAAQPKEDADEVPDLVGVEHAGPSLPRRFVCKALPRRVVQITVPTSAIALVNEMVDRALQVRMWELPSKEVDEVKKAMRPLADDVFALKASWAIRRSRGLAEFRQLVAVHLGCLQRLPRRCPSPF